MEIKAQYQDQVKLLLDVLPLVNEEPCFALKGGTAINLFEWDLPRLSVDIDLTYLPTHDRETALTAISDALARIKARIEDKLKPTRVTLVRQNDGLEVKLHCQRFRTQIKVEANPVLRGHIMPVRPMSCSDKVQDLFGRFVETPVISRGDLFDVKLLLDHEDSLPDDIRVGMMAGLVSHSRPIAELIRPTLKDRQQSFQSEFEGMPFLPFTHDDHLATFERLKHAVITSFNENDRAFLISFTSGDPDWTLFPIDSLQALPGPEWKLRNIRHLRESNPERHAQGLQALESALSDSSD